ncbi:PhnD/SsuA/transferrin family substrate-binding protein [Desulfoprunum benzoelyticum]|uniref:Putative nucleotidyltransferase with HDIG domain n=1 Tax=Desulfoprunum benzoelyticum TaxID=1506996 RepID=A0A840UP80_9BACT|nr:PhnD/SsuA/transferrin family substrate-binding protein [Desulfoprunum benzoelyticum]MBB5347572.1 putative nucleotidyltransferase with HDIG domain [Desulfoprunum benzoelyticum]MBM9531110.1 PhnD/SsuA/transferrin family substrate-binding protein [Desulfoprunum benzoelyticum]
MISGIYRVLLALLLLLPVFLAAGDARSQAARDVRIGLLAKRGSEIDVQLWTATADYLTARLPGHRFHLVPLDFTEIHDAAREAKIDFVLANSAFYVELEKLYGVNRIATLINRNLPGQQTTTFGGVVFARADRHDIKGIKDLRNRRFMAVEPRSFGGWLVCWRELKRLGIDPLRFFASLEYGNTHDAVVQAVQSGTVDAGTVRTDTLERMAEAGSIQLDEFRILNERQVAGFPFKLSTALYPEWPMAAIRTTPAELTRRVASALLAMDSDDPAARASNSAGWAAPLNYQPVHDCLLDLRIGPYADFGQFTLNDVLRRYWRQLAVMLLLVTVVLLTSLYILRLNRRLRQKNREVDELNATLEDKVVERTSRVNTLLDQELYLREIMETIAEVNGLLISATDLETLLPAACQAMSEHSHYGYCWIGLLHDGLVDTVFSTDAPLRLPGEPPFNPFDPTGLFAASAEGRCITTNRTVVMVREEGEGDATPGPDPATTGRFRAVVALPLRADRHSAPLGALCVYTMRREGFEPEEIAMLEELAGNIGFAVNSFRQKEQVAGLERARIENYQQTIRSFADMIDQRDTYTAGHTLRVARYSRLLALQMGLAEEQIDLLQQAAILHDIGKIATPDSVLLKPGKLSALDYDLIKNHASAGHVMLAGIPMYRELAEIIRHHHERHDGMGYPDHLGGKDIPLLARIIVVADSFDAMTTNRIYKPRKTVDEALRELNTLGGSQFDPDVVAAGLIALRNVEIPESINQLPRNQMEQRRFLYFFSDKLTGLYNEDYLQIMLRNNQVLREFHCLHSLHVNNLEQYNLRLGWEQGNLLMQKIATELQALFPGALLFRAYGRDFVIITARHVHLAADSLHLASLDGTEVTLEANHTDLLEDTTYAIDKLEHLEITSEADKRR